MSISINGVQCEKIHFTGIFGSGMSAIAQYLCWKGLSISGSDRLLSSADTANIQEKLLSCGCSIFPQDGSGITDQTNAICVSTAIEESNPEMAAARALGIPIVHRSDVLAAIVETRRSIAVAGTSGKSTVTAMIFEFLTACGMSPSLISGAGLRSLEQKGLIGNAYSGESDLLVIEADESDGTLVKYQPHCSVVLNLSKDHKSEEEVKEMFARLVKQSKWSAVNADDSGLDTLGAPMTFGFSQSALFRADTTELHPLSSIITVNGTQYNIPLPGLHNASNLLAALCVCDHFSCNPSLLEKAVPLFQGVDRRFMVYKTQKGVTVVDDFAHNPEKIRAAVTAAHQLSQKVFAIYQPHGFGPTRFLKQEYAEVFRAVLRPSDTLYLLPIYYAGGSAVMDIRSEDLIALLGQVPFKAAAIKNRESVGEEIRNSTSSGDCVILMGARDPSLAPFARQIVTILGGEQH